MLITRYAPSPTGEQHIGGIRTALYCRLLARKTNGKFLLRIEDTDQARSTKVYEQGIIDSLRRFGLDRDAGPDKDDENGPYYQMPRLEIYNTYIQQLLEKGDAYYAWETPEEIEAMRQKAYAEKKAFNFREIQYTDEQIRQFQAEGRKPVVRFKVNPNKVIEFEDGVKGEVKFVMQQFGDFVIQKSDGIPTYYLANVVDDYLQKVNYVIRGEEHLSNTPKQICLYDALGREHPRFAHLPLMLSPSGKKMSKRDTDIGLTLVPQFRDAGFLPEALINFIALLGRNPGTEREFFSLEELIEHFSMERVNKSNAVYDFKRALWFNSEYIKRLDDKTFITKIKDYLAQYGDEERQEILRTDDIPESYWIKFAPYIKVRIQTLAQFRDFCKYFFLRIEASEELVYKEKMKITPELIQEILPELIALLESLSEDQWIEETLKSVLVDYIASKGLKNGQVLRPLRAILTGVQASPGAFEMLYILGKEESLLRLKERGRD